MVFRWQSMGPASQRILLLLIPHCLLCCIFSVGSEAELKEADERSVICCLWKHVAVCLSSVRYCYITIACRMYLAQCRSGSNEMRCSFSCCVYFFDIVSISRCLQHWNSEHSVPLSWHFLTHCKICNTSLF
jgi:hypothetical protein